MVFLGPILAQVAMLGVTDRTEARYLYPDKYSEASTRPAATLSVGWKHTSLTLGYAPFFTLSSFDTSSRQLTIFHAGFVSVSQSWRRLRLTVSEIGGYGEQSLRSAAVAPAIGATPPGTTTGGTMTGTPTTPGTPTGANPGGVNPQAQVLRISPKVIRLASSITTVALEDRISATLMLRGDLSYLIGGAVEEEDRVVFPIVRGPRASVSLVKSLSHTDDVGAFVSGQYASATNQNSVWVSAVSGNWGHKFNARTASMLGVGVSGTATPLTGDIVEYTIYPVLNASIVTSAKLARGIFSAGFFVNSSPAVDLTTAVVDPRVALTATAGWARDRFSANVGANTILSTATPGSQGSLTSVAGFAGVGYAVAKFVSVDSGVRVAYQFYEGQTVLPLSYAGYVGLTCGFQTPL